MIALITSLIPIINALLPTVISAFIKIYCQPFVENVQVLPPNPNIPSFNIYAKP